MAENDVRIALGVDNLPATKNAIKSVLTSLQDMEKNGVLAAKEASRARIAILKEEARIAKEIGKAELRVRVDAEKRAAKEAADFRLAQEKRIIREVNSNLNRARGTGGASPRGGLLGGGAFGASGSAEMFAAREFGFGGVMRLGGALGATGAVVGVAIMAFKAALDVAATALKTFGSFVLNDIIKPELNLQTSAVQLANRSAGGLTAADAKAAVNEAFVRYGISKEESMKGLGHFGAHGGEAGWKEAPKALRFAAQEALARGTPVEQTMDLLARLREPGESYAEVQQKYLNVQKLGDIYNVPIEEMGTHLGDLKRISSKLKGNKQEQTAMANAMLQLIVPYAKGDVAGAFTSMDRLLEDITGKAKSHFKGARKGIITKEHGEEVIDLPKALAAILAKEKGERSRILGVGIKDERAIRSIEALRTRYAEAYDKAIAEGATTQKAYNIAAQAVSDKLIELSKITGSAAEEQAKAEEAAGSGSKGLEIAFNDVSQILTEIFGPSVKMAIEDVIPMFDELTDYLEENSDEISEALESLTKIFVIGAKLIEYELVGMVEVFKFLVNKFKYLVPGLGPIDAVLQGTTGKGILDTIYNEVTGKDAEGKPKSGVIPRRLRKRGVVTVGELTFGAPPPEGDFGTLDSGPTGAGIAEQPGAAGSAEKTNDAMQKTAAGHAAVAKEAADLTAKLEALKKQVADLTNQLGTLNRTKKFGAN